MAYEIVAVRREPTDDLSHDHISLVGFISNHLPDEEIYVDAGRIVQRLALGEKFVVDIDGEKVDVQPATCAVCGEGPSLKTAKDTSNRQYLLDLPFEWQRV